MQKKINLGRSQSSSFSTPREKQTEVALSARTSKPRKAIEAVGCEPAQSRQARQAYSNLVVNKS